MYKKKNTMVLSILLFIIILLLPGWEDKENQKEDTIVNKLENREIAISSELFYQESIKLQYAEKFAIDYYQDGYLLISIENNRSYLVVPEGKEAPEDLNQEIVVLKRPINRIYLVATAVMDMFRQLNSLDAIRFSGQRAEGWSMEEVQKEMEKGTIVYAGKYNMPDYELIMSENCSLAIENNMISHSPEVVEKLESFGIPVLIDFSSYESHPLGRVEWIKLYGVLLQKEEAANRAFENQSKRLEQIKKEETSKQTVVFFYLTTNGMVNVRAASDYIPKMIELAGGTYLFEHLKEEESNRSSVTMQMEEFYHTAKNADYLIYNSTIDGELASIEELLQKEDLLKDFKAVEEGRVWCTTKDLYQQSMSIGQMIEELHRILSQDIDGQEEMVYFYRLQ